MPPKPPPRAQWDLILPGAETLLPIAEFSAEQTLEPALPPPQLYQAVRRRQDGTRGGLGGGRLVFLPGSLQPCLGVLNPPQHRWEIHQVLPSPTPLAAPTLASQALSCQPDLRPP